MPYKILEGERVIMEKKKKTIVFGKYTNTQQRIALKSSCRDITGGPVVKNQPPNAGDAGLIPRQGTKHPTCFGATRPQSDHPWTANCKALAP